MDKIESKILIIDKDEEFLANAGKHLRNAHYFVAMTTSTKNALEIIENDRFDIAIADINLQEQGDTSFIRALKQKDAEIAIVITTPSPNLDGAIAAMKAGASDYIIKSSGVEAIRSSVQDIFQTKQDRVETLRLGRIYDEIKNKILGTLELKNIVDSVTEGATRLLNANGASLNILDKRTGQLRLTSSYGLSNDYLAKGPISAYQSIAETIQEKKIIFIEDTQNDPRLQYPQDALREGIKSILSIPLIAKNESFGALRIYSHEKKKFSIREMEYIKQLVDITSLCIMNGRMYQDYKDQYDTLRDDLWDYFDKVGWE